MSFYLYLVLSLSLVFSAPVYAEEVMGTTSARQASKSKESKEIDNGMKLGDYVLTVAQIKKLTPQQQVAYFYSLNALLRIADLSQSKSTRKFAQHNGFQNFPMAYLSKSGKTSQRISVMRGRAPLKGDPIFVGSQAQKDIDQAVEKYERYVASKFRSPQNVDRVPNTEISKTSEKKESFLGSSWRRLANFFKKHMPFGGTQLSVTETNIVTLPDSRRGLTSSASGQSYNRSIATVLTDKSQEEYMRALTDSKKNLNGLVTKLTITDHRGSLEEVQIQNGKVIKRVYVYAVSSDESAKIKNSEINNEVTFLKLSRGSVVYSDVEGGGLVQPLEMVTKLKAMCNGVADKFPCQDYGLKESLFASSSLRSKKTGEGITDLSKKDFSTKLCVDLPREIKSDKDKKLLSTLAQRCSVAFDNWFDEQRVLAMDTEGYEKFRKQAREYLNEFIYGEVPTPSQPRLFKTLYQYKPNKPRLLKTLSQYKPRKFKPLCQYYNSKSRAPQKEECESVQKIVMTLCAVAGDKVCQIKKNGIRTFKNEEILIDGTQ